MIRFYKTWHKKFNKIHAFREKDKMKISVIGTGYVGLSAAVGFAKLGHDVICYDVIPEKLEMIKNGKSPIYEPLIDQYLGDVVSEGRLKTSTDLDRTVKQTEVSFLCVGTPSSEDGSIDLSYIREASRELGTALREKGSYHTVVVKSTVLPETTEGVVLPLLEESGLNAGKDFGLCMNPEFLREGCALEDFLHPDRIVIGELDSRSGEAVNELYQGFGAPILRTNLKVAEMIKYASNAFLATKISYSNEIGNICKKLGIDVYDVMRGVGLDSRISPKFLQAGCGFGGSCFPKDVSALIAKSGELGHEPKLLKEVLDTNERQKLKIMEHLERKVGDLEGKRIAVLGLSFKANTDDVRESPAIKVISYLKYRGADIAAHDPQGMDNMRAVFPDIAYHETPQSALRDSDAAVIS